MAKKGKKAKSYKHPHPKHYSNLRANHPYVKSAKNREMIGTIIFGIILLGIIGVLIWGFATNWGNPKSKDEFQCGKFAVGTCHGRRMGALAAKNDEEESNEKFSCGKFAVGTCHGSQMAALAAKNASKAQLKESYCGGGCAAEWLQRTAAEDEFDAGVF